MRALSTREIVRLWEWGRHKHAVDRALGLLTAAAPEAGAALLSDLTIGQRDGVLLALRRDTIGPTLELSSRCPGCGAPYEFAMRCDDLFAAPPSLEPDRRTHAFDRGDLHVDFRLPNSRDLAATASHGDRLEARRVVFARTILAARRGERAVEAGDLAPEELDALGEAVLAIDQQAEIRFNLRCFDCERAWAADLDIASFLWVELEVRAKRALREVHLLAKSYGWDEDRILALSTERRKHYIELAEG